MADNDEVLKDAADQRSCVMTISSGQADWQSLDKLNRLLDEGWRIAGINPSLERLPGVVKCLAFFVDLKKPPM